MQIKIDLCDITFFIDKIGSGYSGSCYSPNLLRKTVEVMKEKAATQHIATLQKCEICVTS